MNTIWHDIRRVIRRPRLLMAALVGILIFALLAPSQPLAFSLLVAFNIATGIFLVLIGWVMGRADVVSMRNRAKIQDDNKWIVLIASLCVAAIVVIALSIELHAAKEKSVGTIALASSTILLAWLFVAIMFAQQYAHDFYMTAGQLVFPGTEQPDYWDFTYFAVILSMCCQTSDVIVTSSKLRRLVLLHSVVSFFFNVIIIAIAVSVAAGSL
jgi:uncharacterized membrane protein